MKSPMVPALCILIVFVILASSIPVEASSNNASGMEDPSPLIAIAPLGENGCGTSEYNVPDGDALSAMFGELASQLFGTGKLAIWKDACNAHDRCYDSVGAPKKRCDENFRDNMIRSCANFYGAGSSLVAKIDPYYYVCEANAKVYYEVVAKYGKGAYDRAQANARKALSCTSGKSKYKISIYTSNKNKGGTDADVVLVLYGSKGSRSPTWPLDKPKINDFERNHIDVFNTQEIKDIGSIVKVLVKHNNKGDGPGWHLEKITVQNVCQKDKIWTFKCNRWLAKDEEDGSLQRIITTDRCQ